MRTNVASYQVFSVLRRHKLLSKKLEVSFLDTKPLLVLQRCLSEQTLDAQGNVTSVPEISELEKQKLISNPILGYRFAEAILQDRFLEAEVNILNDSEVRRRYLVFLNRLENSYHKLVPLSEDLELLIAVDPEDMEYYNLYVRPERLSDNVEKVWLHTIYERVRERPDTTLYRYMTDEYHTAHFRVGTRWINYENEVMYPTLEDVKDLETGREMYDILFNTGFLSYLVNIHPDGSYGKIIRALKIHNGLYAKPLVGILLKNKGGNILDSINEFLNDLDSFQKDEDSDGVKI